MGWGLQLVSVVIPVFNRQELLLRAVRSVLAQTVRDFELIVVDDGSSEPIAEAVTKLSPDAVYLRHKHNRGAAAARNAGIARASGHYIAFLDSDDEWHPEKLERQLAFMRRHSECRASCTGFALVDEELARTKRTPPAMTDLDDLLWGCRISPGSTLMVERSLFDLAGPHDETLRRLEDWDWLLVAARHTPILGLADILVSVRHDRYAHVDDAHFIAAVKQMERHARAGRYGLSRRQLMILLSALQYELAALSYRKGRYGAAVRAMAASLAYCPWKRPSHILAALQTLRKDAGRAIRS